MKKIILTTAIILSLFNISCKDKMKETVNSEASKMGVDSDESGKTGNFSIDGKDFSGDIETQYFGDKVKGNFSVLMKNEEGKDPMKPDSRLLQITFLTENDAHNSPLKIYHSSILPMTEPEPGIVAVALSGVGNDLGDTRFTGSDKSTGIITVKDNTITLKDIVLFNATGEKKVVNASFSY